MADDVYGYEPLADDDTLDSPADPETPADDEAVTAETPTDPETLSRDDGDTWQAAFTKARQKDRARYAKIEEEHATYKNVLQRFYTDEAYARSVLQQRFPELAAQSRAPGSQKKDGGPLEDLLAGELGEDIQFLAAPLAKAVQAAIQQAIRPFEEQTRAQQQQSRQAQHEAALSELDQKYPGWETHYAEDMATLAQFLAGEQVRHPKYGNKMELLLKILNPDHARIDAMRQQQRAARSQQGRSRPGPAAQPSVRDIVLKTPDTHKAFMLAAQAAAEELGM